MGNSLGFVLAVSCFFGVADFVGGLAFGASFLGAAAFGVFSGLFVAFLASVYEPVVRRDSRGQRARPRSSSEKQGDA